MHLDILESGHRRRARIALWFAEKVGRSPIDDVGKASLYRPDFFGRSWLALVREVMRGPSYWTPAERELFGAVVSQVNRCEYCTQVHSRLAGAAVPAGSAGPDWRDSGHRREVKAILGLLEKVTLWPGEVTEADAEAVRAEGVPDDAIDDALHVAFVFNLVNRLAGGLGFSWASRHEVDKAARVLKRIGYKVPGYLLK